MIKRLLTDVSPDVERPLADWLDLETLAEVEFTSEDAGHPIEAALLPGDNDGWRAGKPGPQTIRLLFKQPQDIRRISLDFIEPAVARTQEYALSWSNDPMHTFHEILRQQWNFSPDGGTRETEDHLVALAGATALELTITPDIGNPGAFATLKKLRIQ